MIMSLSWDLLRSALDIFLLSHCILNDGRPMPMPFRVSVSIFDMNYDNVHLFSKKIGFLRITYSLL